MKKNLVNIFIITLTIFYGCSPTEPEKQKLEIAEEDVSCTEAWIKVTGETGSEMMLSRDGKEVMRFTLTKLLLRQFMMTRCSQIQHTHIKYQVSSLRHQAVR